jgi:hypothetical protein
MSRIKILLAVMLLFTAVAITVPQEGKAGPPGKVEQTVKAVDQSYDFQVAITPAYDAPFVSNAPRELFVKTESVTFIVNQVPVLSPQRFRWCDGNTFITVTNIDYHRRTYLPGNKHVKPPLLLRRE